MQYISGPKMLHRAVCAMVAAAHTNMFCPKSVLWNTRAVLGVKAASDHQRGGRERMRLVGSSVATIRLSVPS